MTAPRDREARGLALPHNHDAEAAVIGAMLLSRDARERVTDMLRPDDFHLPEHAEMFAAIDGLHRRGERVDPTTVHTALGAIGSRVERAELLDIQTHVPASANATAYARDVAAHSARRKLIGACGEVSEMARDATVDIGDVLAHAEQSIHDADIVTAPVPSPDLEEFIVETPEPEFIVDGVIARHDRCLVVALEGAGKSTWLRQIAVQVSQGIHPWWDREVPPIRALVVDVENPPMLARKQYRQLARLAREKAGDRYDPARLRIEMRPEGINLGNRADALWLYGLVEAARPDLLCIGPAYKLHEAEEEKSSDVRQVQKVLDRIRSRWGCALWMETHAPHESFARGGQVRPAGSRLWLRWPEFVLALESRPGRDAEGAWDLVHARAPRDQRPWPRRLVRGYPEEGQWPWLAESY